MSNETRKGGEKSLLGVTKKSYGRSYGSTKKSTQDIYIKHIVSPSDTLAGIALKYSVSVEQIKRANKLYTNDSIFLRSTLSIPVGDQPLPAHVLENATSRANGSPVHKIADDNVLFDRFSSEEEEAAAEEKEDAVTVDDNRDLQMDFFNRIDRELRQGKTNLDKIETNSSVSDIEAASPHVQGSPIKPSVVRTSTSPGASTDNSYQMGMVTVNAESASRRGNELNEITKGGVSKADTSKCKVPGSPQKACTVVKLAASGKEGKVELVSCDEKEALTGGLPSNGKKSSVRLV